MRRRVPALGHALIDRQHARLDGLGRQVRAAVAADRPARALLGQLLLHTRRHFESEERLMRRHRYPDAAGHIALHQGVLKDMLRMRETLRAGLPMHRKHALLLTEWLEHHVSEADRNLVAHLAGRGSRRPTAH